eukprot:959879-Pyramimonas_sp.AAC.1
MGILKAHWQGSEEHTDSRGCQGVIRTAAVSDRLTPQERDPPAPATGRGSPARTWFGSRRSRCWATA